jgi:hypothetical protein
MGLFSSLLGRRGPSPNVAREISLDDYLYLFDYGTHYSEFLSGMSDRARAIAELFLFRGWATQFGFRMFSTHPELSVSIMHETVNLIANTLVRAMLAAKYNVKFEQLYADNLTSLLHSRLRSRYRTLLRPRSPKSTASHRRLSDPVVPNQRGSAETAHPVITAEDLIGCCPQRLPLPHAFDVDLGKRAESSCHLHPPEA